MFKPRPGKLLVRPDAIEKTTDYGFVLSDDSIKEKPHSGIVVSGTEEMPEGAHILFSAYGFDEVVLEKETFYIVSESSVLGIYG